MLASREYTRVASTAHARRHAHARESESARARTICCHARRTLVRIKYNFCEHVLDVTKIEIVLTSG